MQDRMAVHSSSTRQQGGLCSSVMVVPAISSDQDAWHGHPAAAVVQRQSWRGRSARMSCRSTWQHM
jgi:hypothetical protein